MDVQLKSVLLPDGFVARTEEGKKLGQPATSDFCACAALASRFLLECSVDVRKQVAIGKI